MKSLQCAPGQLNFIGIVKLLTSDGLTVEVTVAAEQMLEPEKEPDGVSLL